MEAETFEQNLLEMRSPMRAFAYSLTRDRDDALDLVQETYYKALVNMDKFAEGTNLKAWLMTIMKNIFINNYRRNARRNTIVDTSDNNFLIDSLALSIPNTAETAFIQNDLTEAVRHLDDAYKKPFIMHYRGFKYEEIAAAMKLPLGTVKSRIFFARKQMIEFLDKKGFERN
ncbi:MAG: RNA polymerase sigma factor [Chitinophagales bacterium]